MNALLITFVLETLSSLSGLGAVNPGTVRIFLVRHGEARLNLTPLPATSETQLDHLTPAGKEQMKRVGEALKKQKIATVFSSPTGRTKESAEELQAVTHAPVKIDDRLGPIVLGTNNGAPLTWADRTKMWQSGRDPHPISGESMQQLTERALSVSTPLGSNKSGQSVAFVTHGEVIDGIIGLLMRVPPQRRYSIEVPVGSISVIELTAGKMKVIATNIVPPAAP